MSHHAAPSDRGSIDLLSPILNHLGPLSARVRDILDTQGPALAPTAQPVRTGGFPDASPSTWSDLKPDQSLLARSIRALLTSLGLAQDPGDYTGEYPHQEADFLLALGHDLRKHGLEAEHYGALARALGQAGVDVLTLDEQAQATLEDAADLTCHLLALGAQRSTATATRTAEVLDVAEAYPGDDAAGRPAIGVIRVQENSPQPWWTGQYLDIRTPYGDTQWQYLHPATPANPDGLIEFHVRGDTEARRAILAQAQVGDQWALGASYGFLSVDAEDERPVCMIAQDTGLAPLRALLLELAQRPEPPETALYVGAGSVAEFYELPSLLGFARAWDWLRVVPVAAEAAGIEELTGASAELDGLLRVGHAVNAAIRDGAWQSARVLVAGSHAQATASVDALLAAGADSEQLSVDKA
ncbi:flavohemoprotein [Corynebacterium sp. HMSC27B11]|uniref:flavohemoprotein n=1 Tax=Corynebacterium sp. HMSC27B11 TaxID=1581065 RepID=UPI0008A300BE|nr:flavohemoprotein [Corynebacterium sp. HMSC27B11]OFS18417.1 flavohemoprotein [Corynebacterium sp. HMSC27B11]